MKSTWVLLLLAIVLTACAGSGRSSSYDDLYAQAQNEINVAKQMGFLWRDTERLLVDSRRAHEQGDKKLAIELAQEAIEQAVLAQQQARQQSNPVVRYPQ